MSRFHNELFSVNSTQAINFFFSNLLRITGRITREREMLYVASILAHYSQTSRCDENCMPAMANLSEVFDNFIYLPFELSDPEILEIGGGQILLFNGFFREQMKKRHNVAWFDRLGQSFYYKASQNTKSIRKKEFFEGMSESFPKWAIVCRDLSIKFREDRYLLKIDDK